MFLTSLALIILFFLVLGSIFFGRKYYFKQEKKIKETILENGDIDSKYIEKLKTIAVIKSIFVAIGVGLILGLIVVFLVFGACMMLLSY